MSTRTNILIENNETKLWLYRHHDGYLSETGYDLMVKLIHNKNVTSFVTSLLSQNYEACELHNEKPLYEITSGQHGDIEFLYRFIFDNKKNKVKIDVMEITYYFVDDEVLPFENKQLKNIISTEFFSITKDEIKFNCDLIFKARENAFSYS